MPETVKLSVRIPVDLYRELREIAIEPGQTLQRIASEALEVRAATNQHWKKWFPKAVGRRIPPTPNGRETAHAGGNGKGTTKKLPSK